ncbi:MAG: hypothetical protein PHF66_14205 [Desulfobacteraceae bacterium]|nr:hypothetical protein [Desulfobacteraceae bacterium]
METSAASGMKAALNGVPGLSVPDGWWIEELIEKLTGWSIGASTPAHYQAIAGPGSWLFAFVLGMAIGGFVAGWTSKKIPVRDMPPIWEKRFGDSRAKRYSATFFGGFLILYSVTQNLVKASSHAGIDQHFVQNLGIGCRR